MRIISFIILSSLFMGCASVFQGSMSEVEIKNAPDSLKVYSADGEAIPTRYKIDEIINYHPIHVAVTHYKTDSTTQIIQLRSNKDHLLILKTGSIEHRYMAYAKTNPWWLALDVICGVIPAIYDAVTGNWNYYNEIDYKEQ
jgi:hypothetical protein